MDKRRRLPAGTVLPFPGARMLIHSVVGCGSNAIVYLGGYPDLQNNELEHRVLIKEFFPYDPNGLIFRTDNGEIHWDKAMESIVEQQRASFLRGNEIHLKLLERFPEDVGENLNTVPLNHTLYTVLGFTSGRTLYQELKTMSGKEIPFSVQLQRIRDVLESLEMMHGVGYLHLDVSPDNILLMGYGIKEHAVLIDYNSSYTLDELKNGSEFYYCEKEGYTAPEVRDGVREKIGEWTDFYSLTAVLYFCLSGHPLTILETSQAGPPDLPCTNAVKELPRTAKSMLRHILRRGLSTTVRQRYQNAGEMRRDIEELQDRIAGKGITHWALWETGRASVMQTVRENPALSYIRDPANLLPTRCEDEKGQTGSFDELLKNKGSFLLLGDGGMGKTTALLSIAFGQAGKYSAVEPAICYLSLYGWNEGEASYIKDHLLENMLFKPTTDSLETARHELMHLLSAPFRIKGEERPKLLLLLDGLNEAKGSIEPLLHEIQQLADLPGVKICVASRSEIGLAHWTRLRLVTMESETVSRHLQENGLLVPESAEMRRVLETPLMLSMFVRTSKDKDNQLFIKTKEELLNRYFEAMAEKAGDRLSKDPTDRWLAEAAIWYVLPEIVYAMKKRKGTVSDTLLLPVVERCYRQLGSKEFRKVFPKWIGHISQIRDGAEDAESWYGQIVHCFLWRRLGFLVREPQGGYRLFHSMAEDYLLSLRKRNRRIVLQEITKKFSVRLLTITLLLGGTYRLVYVPYVKPRISAGLQKKAYDLSKSENVLDTMGNAYILAAEQYQKFGEVLTLLMSDEIDEAAFQKAVSQCERKFGGYVQVNTERAMRQAVSLIETGEVMPWSGEPLDLDAYEKLIELAAGREERYLDCLHTLEGMREQPELWDRYGIAYCEELSAALKADGMMTGKLYAVLLDQ